MVNPFAKQCPLCWGLGKILAFGVALHPVALACPECAGLDVLPASAEDEEDAGQSRLAVAEAAAEEQYPGIDDAQAAVA